MPDRLKDARAEETARRVLASWRIRADTAALCVGAQVFCVGTGVLEPVSLNAAWLAALCAIPAAALLALCARCALAAQRERSGTAPTPFSRVLHALLALTLLGCGLAQCVALAGLAQQTLLPQARAAFALLCALPAAWLCAQQRGMGVSRLAFSLRWTLPLALGVLTAAALTREDLAGLFPLLGPGAGALARAALCAPGGAAAALLLFLPPPELTEEQLSACPLPGAGFFAWRAALGAAAGAALLFALALCGSYETLAEMTRWGERMRVLSAAQPREGLVQTALTLAQTTALLLSAAAVFGASAQAAERALCATAKKERKGYGMVLCVGLSTLAAWMLIDFGFDIARLAMPCFALPALLLALCARKF